jgi:uncharacterized membrane protein YphA (DoxX/SURF4 family)
MNRLASTMPTARPGSKRARLSITSWVLQGVAAAILFQTLFFKFTAAEESVYIFSQLGVEPWGRIGSGIIELIACVLLLVPRAVAWGALLAMAVVSAAVLSHLTKLGIVVKDDGGLLFILAMVVLAASLGIVIIRRRELLPGARACSQGEGSATLGSLEGTR